MAVFSDNPFPSILIVEQTNKPTTPVSGNQRLYIKSDHKLYHEGSDGIETQVGSGSEDYILIRDEKSTSTDGGTFASGAWQTRDLTAEVSDLGNHASLANNQITLDAGTYRVCISAPAHVVGRHQAILYNVTDAIIALVGTSEYSKATQYYASTTRSIIVGIITIAAPKVFEIRHQCDEGSATMGFGVANTWTTEIYTIAEFWKKL